MSLRRSLNRLETSAAKSSDELVPHLARLLGTIDACLWPARYTSITNYHAIMAAQADYHANGISFTLESSDQASWKASERLRTALCNEGWAEPCESGKIRLTLLGDCVARQAVGLPALGNEIVEHVFGVLGELPEERPGGWISEAALFGLTDDTDYKAIHSLTELMAPLLVHRCVESVSSTAARVFYKRLIDSLPSVDVPSIDYSASCCDEYSKSFCRHIEVRKTASYDGSEIWIPLTSSR